MLALAFRRSGPHRVSLSSGANETITVQRGYRMKISSTTWWWNIAPDWAWWNSWKISLED